MLNIVPNWHPIFVHFTVALLSVSLLIFMVSFFLKSEITKHQARTVARWNFWLAVVVTIATVVAGWLAYNSVAHDTPSHEAMTEHKNWAFITFTILLFVAAGTWWFKGGVKFFGAGLLTVFIFLSITAWHGGELVYRYGLGVMSMPTIESKGHGQDSHGELTHDAEKLESTQTEINSHAHDKLHEH